MTKHNNLRHRRHDGRPIAHSCNPDPMPKSSRASTSPVVNSLVQRQRLRMLCGCAPIAFLLLALYVLLPVVIIHDEVLYEKNSLENGRRLSENGTGTLRTTFGSFEVLEIVPHDPSAFTQGLLTVTDFSDGSLKFLEGTGLYGQSELRLVKISTGEVLSRHLLAAKYFGEGIAHYRDSENHTLRVIQITWMENTAFEFILQTGNYTQSLLDSIWGFWEKINSMSFCWRNRRPRVCLTRKNASSVDQSPLSVEAPLSSFLFNTTKSEGWGITYSTTTKQFLVTDGSQYLHSWEGSTRKLVSKVAVTYQTVNDALPVQLSRLNEIEWDPVSNTVLANVWYQDIIARIDPINGFVHTFYNLATLYPEHSRDDVLNGIALTYDSSLQITPSSGTDEVWVTGKLWPKMFRIRLIDQ